MKVYFCCTSMFHLLISAFLCKVNYKNSHNVLIILEHTSSKWGNIEDIRKSGVWDEIICINNETKEKDFVIKEIEKINFSSKDICHLFGFEYISFYIAKYFPDKGKIIFTEEGYTTWDIKRWMKVFYDKSMFDGEDYCYDKIDEIWMLEPKLSMNTFCNCIRKINISDCLEDKEFLSFFVETLKRVFGIQYEASLSGNDIILFDGYFSSIHWMSDEMEQYMLNEIVTMTKKIGITIKVHPNESNYNKYSQIEDKYIEKRKVPWEVVVLIDKKEQISLGKTYISCGSNAIITQRIMLREFNSNVIFLYKLYEEYCGLKVETSFIDNYQSIYHDKNIHCPSNFYELNRLLSRLYRYDEEYSYKTEFEKSLKFYKKAYLNIWKRTPANFNFSTLLFYNTENRVAVDIREFEQNREIYFGLNVSVLPNTEVFWYVLRGIPLKICISSIVYYYKDESSKEKFPEFDVSQGNIDINGFLFKNTFDTILKLPNPDKELIGVKIVSKWSVMLSYQRMLEVFHAVGEEMNEKIQSLTSIIENNSTDLKSLLNDIDSRDKAIETLLNDINGRDKTVETLLNDINGRDKTVKTLLNDIQDRDNTMRTLLNDISDRDNLITCEEENLKRKEMEIINLQSKLDFIASKKLSNRIKRILKKSN